MTQEPVSPTGPEDNPILRLSPPEVIAPNLDPRLQGLISGIRPPEPLPGAKGVLPLAAPPPPPPPQAYPVDVLAKLHDPVQPVPGLNIVRTIGQIVTGTVSTHEILQVRSHPNVWSLKLANRLYRTLEYSVPDIEATPTHLAAVLPPDMAAPDGSSVIIGIIDEGCDFNHRNFRNADGTSRILYLWNQSGWSEDGGPAPVGYGVEYGQTQINLALDSPDPYNTLGYQPGEKSHGTHVMDIAAGNGRATDWPGVAPDAHLIFVDIASGDWSGEAFFGNSRRLLEAADYIFAKAAELGKPAVINISMGTHGGPHDGTSLLEQGLDTLLRNQVGRAIVISAGNSYDVDGHASGAVDAAGTRTLTWHVPDQDETDNELEVWYSGAAELAVTLITPWSLRLGPVPLGATRHIDPESGSTLGYIAHRQRDPNNGENNIAIYLSRMLPPGNWAVELSNRSSEPVPFDAYIERDDQEWTYQSRFAPADADSQRTIGSISGGELPIAVGSYCAGLPGKAISKFSSAGPTRSGRRKPEVSAPGSATHDTEILAAASLTQGTVPKSGTSMAAPHVTGAVALLMQAAGRPLSIQEIREALIATARLDPPPGDQWHPQYGFGRISGAAAVLGQLTGNRAATPLPKDAPYATRLSTSMLAYVVHVPVADDGEGAGDIIIVDDDAKGPLSTALSGDDQAGVPIGPTRQLEFGDVVVILGGPTYADGMIWWEASREASPDREWVSEGDNEKYYLAPLRSRVICSDLLPSRVALYDLVAVIPDAPGVAKLYAAPAINARCSVIEAGQVFRVIGGPACMGSHIFWQVEGATGFNWLGIGWLVECDQTTYWLAPIWHGGDGKG